MVKKLIFLLLSMSLLKAEGDQSDPELSTTEAILVVSALGAFVVAGSIVIAPFVLPAGALVGLKAGMGAVAIKVAGSGAVLKAATGGLAIKATAAAPLAGKVSMGITAIQIARPYIFPAVEQELADIEAQERAALIKARDELLNCIEKNKFELQKKDGQNTSPCQDAARALAMFFSHDELVKMSKQRENGDA